jgi:Kef-type K+ transport system membrane component KefB
VTESEIQPILVSLSVLLAAAHVLGYAAVKLGQPRFVGEILAGVLLGPFVLGTIAPDASLALLGDPGGSADATKTVLGFLSWLGLLLLMFVSGSEVRRVLAREQRGPTAWILGLGTAVPFAIVFGASSAVPLDGLEGPAGGKAALVIVLATAAAVTSIPVISRIFHDLRILHTRFASLILGTAMLEDIGLFAALAVATSLAQSGASSPAGEIAAHTGVTVAFLAVGLLLAPRLLTRVSGLRVNVLARRAKVGYTLLLMFVYTAIAAVLDVNVVFAAFLAGFGLVGGMSGADRERFREPLDAISRVSFATFIPLFFLLVGTRLDLGAGFSLTLLLAILVGSSALRIALVGTASRAAGFGARDALDVAIAMNARGGPGIVLATIAFETGIIASNLFTALVVTAVVTSQAAGWWLGRVLRERGELLGEPIRAQGDAAGERRDRRGPLAVEAPAHGATP